MTQEKYFNRQIQLWGERTQKSLQHKKIAIIGDIKNSRVASSNIELLPRFGLDLFLVAPKKFKMPSKFKTTKSIKKIIDKVDIIMSLRVQHERHKNNLTQEQLQKNIKMK